MSRRWLGAAAVVVLLVAAAVWAGQFGSGHVTGTVVVPAAATAHRYAPPRVEIGDGVNLNPSEVAATIATIINDPRSWNTDLDRFTVRISLPRYVSVICGGNTACATDRTAWIGSDAWTALLPAEIPLGVTLDEQRTWFVNHELGHLLGLGHQECTRPGTPAPVMRPFMSRLHGCTLNLWPKPRG